MELIAGLLLVRKWREEENMLFARKFCANWIKCMVESSIQLACFKCLQHEHPLGTVFLVICKALTQTRNEHKHKLITSIGYLYLRTLNSIILQSDLNQYFILFSAGTRLSLIQILKDILTYWSRYLQNPVYKFQNLLLPCRSQEVQIKLVSKMESRIVG